MWPVQRSINQKRVFGAGASPCSGLRCWGGCCILTLPPLPKALNFPQPQPLISQQSDTNTVSLDKSSAFTSPTLGRVRAEGVMLSVMIKTSCCSREGNPGALSCRKKDTKNLRRLGLSDQNFKGILPKEQRELWHPLLSLALFW